MAKLNNLTITVFGGTGFLGRHLVKYLCETECLVQIPTRNVAKSYFLQTSGDVGQITSIPCNFSNSQDINKVIKNSDIVINLIGILNEKRKGEFDYVHFDIVKKIIDSCNLLKVKKLIHLSAIGSEENKNSLYAQSKLKAERYILKNLKNSYIIRPSIIFGPEDNFFNLFAKMSLFSPILPLIMGGKTKFQPVYVEDVCSGIVEIIKKDNIKKYIYEFGGPDVYSFKELLQIILKVINRKRFLLYIPKFIAIPMAKILSLLPYPLLTPDQLKLLEKDNVVSKKHLTFKDLNIKPVSLEIVIEDYLKRFTKKRLSF